MSFVLAIAGRPNVGKSTLFNRLTGRQHAIVHDQPGVTRDWREGEVDIAGFNFSLLDTAGFEDADAGTLPGRMSEQTKQAISRATAVALIVDGTTGITPDDHSFAKWLRSCGKPVMVLVNKCDSKSAAFSAHEAWELGLGEPIAISAAHGDGIIDFLEAVAPLIDDHDDDEETASARKAKQLQLAIVGRPNAGKSTLMNALLGEERVLTGPEPGITRDAISVPWNFNGTDLTLIDTAGMRRRSNVTANLEQMSLHDSLRAIKYAQVAILVLDATTALEKQDLTIASHIEREGRALVIALNKWDLVDNKSAFMNDAIARLEHALPQVRGVPLIPISALHGHGLDKLIKAALKCYELWNKRFSTSELNRFLEAAVDAHTPPLVGGRRIKLQYMTQPKTRPPGFVIFGSKLDNLPESYEKYLTGALRESFQMPGVPIRIHLRSKKNPYDKRG